MNGPQHCLARRLLCGLAAVWLAFAASPSTLKAQPPFPRYTTYVAAGRPGALTIQVSPNAGHGENDLFAAATATDGSTWGVGWEINTTTGSHDPLILQGKNGGWSLVSSPSLGPGSDTGFAAIAAIPGGGVWAVGVTGPGKGNGSYSTLVEYHP